MLRLEILKCLARTLNSLDSDFRGGVGFVFFLPWGFFLFLLLFRSHTEYRYEITASRQKRGIPHLYQRSINRQARCGQMEFIFHKGRKCLFSLLNLVFSHRPGGYSCSDGWRGSAKNR